MSAAAAQTWEQAKQQASAALLAAEDDDSVLVQSTSVAPADAPAEGDETRSSRTWVSPQVTNSPQRGQGAAASSPWPRPRSQVTEHPNLH